MGKKIFLGELTDSELFNKFQAVYAMPGQSMFPILNWKNQIHTYCH